MRFSILTKLSLLVGVAAIAFAVKDTGNGTSFFFTIPISKKGAYYE